MTDRNVKGILNQLRVMIKRNSSISQTKLTL